LVLQEKKEVIRLIKESLKISLDSLRHRKVSSALTILGIVIGITAIIGLVSIGEGLRESVSEQLEQFGSDKIMIMSSYAGNLPGTAFLGEGLKDSDVKKIERVRGVSLAIGIVFKTFPVKYDNKIKTTYVAGLPAKDSKKFFSDLQSFKLKEGRYFKENEDDVAVLGIKIAEDTFDKEINIGDYLEIKDKKIKVIGILKSIGSTQDDQSVIIPIETLRDITGEKDSLSMIFAKASEVSRVDDIAKSIENKLDKEYGEGAFMAMTSEQIIERIGSILSILSFVLGGIASISLIVAGVGIANTMFTSVLERTREIGIMKAIGATNYNIMEIFLIESALLGFIGGIIGCVFGFIFSKIVNVIAAGMLPVEFKTVVTWEMILLGLGFSVVVGVISGLYPARKAAKLQPVEALRYE